MITEPLVSEVAMSDGAWLAYVIDSDGHRPDPGDVDERAWVADMRQAARILSRLGPEPRQLVIVHPAGYGHNPA